MRSFWNNANVTGATEEPKQGRRIICLPETQLFSQVTVANPCRLKKASLVSLWNAENKEKIHIRMTWDTSTQFG